MDGDTRLGWSNVENVNITIPGGTAKPTAKTGVALLAVGLTAITITWSEVPDADHYRVRYWTSGLSGWMDIATQETGLTVTHPNLEPGTQYYYIVRGENAAGNGPYSGSAGNYASLTLGAVDLVPTLTGTHASRQVVQLPGPRPRPPHTYLQRGKSIVAVPMSTDITWSAVTLTASDTASRSYTDNNAAYDPDTTTMYPLQGAGRERRYPGPVVGYVYGDHSPNGHTAGGAPSNLAATAGSNAVSSITLGVDSHSWHHQRDPVEERLPSLLGPHGGNAPL